MAVAADVLGNSRDVDRERKVLRREGAQQFVDGGTVFLDEGALGAAAVIAVGLVRVHGRVEGCKLVLVLIAVFALVSVIR